MDGLNPRAEVWKKIPGFDQRYEVSSLGRVKGATGKILKLKQDKRGYAFFSIADKKGSSRNVSVARCVCSAFNGEAQSDSLDCDHVNRIRDDNRPENLRWVTRSENLSNRQNRYGTEHHNAKLTPDQVRLIRSIPARHGLNTELAKQYGVGRKTISDVRLGKQWSHVDAR